MGNLLVMGTDRPSSARELLSGSTRRAWFANDDDTEHAIAPRGSVDPGRVTASDVQYDPETVRRAAPGKLVTADTSGPAMSPADALTYTAWMLDRRNSYGARIDRKADANAADLDDGALATAFSFLDDVRDGQSLPARLAERLQRELGIDLARVRIHTDRGAAQAAAAIGARAFTIGDDIYFAEGAYAPDSEAGIELIAHEVAHVGQHERGGRASRGRLSHPDEPHERQADDFAQRFARQQPLQGDRSDPATLVEYVRRAGRRFDIPGLPEIEEQLGGKLDFVEAYTGEAAALACQLMAAGAFAVRNIVAFADPSPRREQLVHELTHVVQMRSTGEASVRFVPGSLQVSDPHGEAEVEAWSGTTAPEISGDAYTVHRDDGTATEPDSVVEQRFSYFLDQHQSSDTYTEQDAEGADPPSRFGIKQGVDWLRRYYVSSKAPFKLAYYKETIASKFPDKGDGDLSRIYPKTKWRLSKVKPASVFWAWTGDNKYETEIDDEQPRARSQPEPRAQWAFYSECVKDQQTYNQCLDFRGVTFGDAPSPYSLLVNCTPHPDFVYTKAEADAFRKKLSKAISDNPRYKSAEGRWGAFAKEIIHSPVFGTNNGLVGNIFEKLCESSIGNLSPKRPHFDFKNAEGIDYLRKGDGMILEYDNSSRRIIAECKAYRGGPSQEVLDQALDYARAIGALGAPPFPSYHYEGAGTKVDDLPYNHIVYFFPDAKVKNEDGSDGTTTVAQAWFPELCRVFNDSKTKPKWFSTVPPPNNTVEMVFTVNPTFRVDLPDLTKTHHALANPLLSHPGLTFSDLDVTLKQPGKADVANGHVWVEYNMAGGALKQDKTKKELKPSTSGTGANAQVENKFDKVKTSLDKILSRVAIDAKVVDGGVQAIVKVAKGASGIPNITFEESTLTVTYTGSGALVIDGKVNFAHTSGKIAAALSVGWDGSGWTFNGEATVAEGLIDGLQAFKLTVKYAGGSWSIGCDQVKYVKRLKAVTVTGTANDVWYDVKKGSFSGQIGLKVDLGMLGNAAAGATIEDNKIKNAQLIYDSPELTYPAKSSNPTFKGTIGGTVTYDHEKFSGAIRGTAKLNVPALQKLAGEGGLGLAVDAHVNPDGSYGGTIHTTSPLKFGKYFEVPSVSCTINDDGSVDGDFAIKIKNIKHLESAEIGCKIDKTGFHVIKADIHATFGKPTDKMWGGLDVGYDATAGLKITGTLNVTIKDGMVATGTLTYNSDTNTIDTELSVDEIKLFELHKKQNLFKFSKQIPLVSFYQIIGIYLDLGLDLDFQFDMSLGLKPTVKLDGLSMDTWEFNKISAEIQLLGQLRAALVATPKVGLGLFALSPELLRGGGGIKVPITGEALLNPTGTLKVGYSPSGKVEGDASIGMQLTFGIKGAIRPYAEAAVLDGAWNPSWTGDSLADFEILPPKELFNFTLDLAGDMKPKQPELPTTPQAPKAPTAAKQMPQDAPKTSDAGGTGPGKDAVPPTTAPAGGAADDSVFKMSSLTGALKGLPGFTTISGFMEKAAKVWDKIKGFFGRVAKAFKSFFESIGNAVEEVLNGFANEGLGYLPKLIKKIVGDSVWEIIEPIVTAAASTADAILHLFETDPPKNAGEFFTWGLQLMQKAFGVAFNSLPELIAALHTMLTRLAGLAKKIVTKMVQDGMIGVKRHHHSFWFLGDYMLADEYKINLLGTSIYFRQGSLPDPNDLIAGGLFDVFEAMGVPPTNTAVDDKMHIAYRDRWV